MHLRIDKSTGNVRVSAPLTYHLTFIQKQIETKRDWLHAQRARFKAQPTPTQPTLQTGELHFFLGSPYLLTVLEAQGRPSLTLSEQSLTLFIKPNATLLEKERVLYSWYRQQMQIRVPSLIEKWQPIMGVQVSAWRIKRMTSRWGSCNTRERRISLNLNLMKKPIACLEYVLVHEMIHILEASHNKRFYAMMQKFLPEWQTYQKLLTET